MINHIKWMGTIFIVLATISRVMLYHYADLVFGAIGTLAWIWVAYRTKENALLAVNVFCILVLIVGFLK